MRFGFVCVSHEPPLPSPSWPLTPDRLAAVLAVRASLVGLAGVDGTAVTLGEDARWLLWHPNCDVQLAGPDGTPVTLEAAAALATTEPEASPPPPAPEPEDEAAAPAEDAEDDEDDDDGDLAADEAPPRLTTAPAPVSLERGMRRPRSLPPPDIEDGVEVWHCQRCGAAMTEQQAVLSWSRRELLCPKDTTARKVG